METKDEKDQLKALKRQVKDLETALAKMTVKNVLNEAYFEIACEKSGITDIEGMKKKIAALHAKRDS